MRRATTLRIAMALFASIAVAKVSVAGEDSDNLPEASQIERFLKIRAPYSPSLAPDGRLYMLDWPDGITQLYRRDEGLDPEAPLVRLTDYEHGVGSYSLSPDGRHLLISVDSAGDEQWDLHLLDTASDEITPLKVDPKVRFGLQLWLADSSAFIYSANDQKPADFYLYRHEMESGESSQVFGGEGMWFVVDANQDGSRLLVGQFTSVSKADAYELDVAAGNLRSLNVEDEYYNQALGYLPDERSVALISDATDSGLRRLHLITSGDEEEPTRPVDLGSHEVEGWNMNQDRSFVAILYNESAYSTLRVFRLPGFEPVEIPNIEPGVIYGVSIVGSTLVYSLSNVRTPGLAFAVDLSASPMEPRSITKAEDQGIDLSAFELPRLISYRSFDGKMIPAFLFLPPGYQEGSPIPFIAHYHGGPESQFRPYFGRQTQYLLSQGYGIIQPNVRGSTGYGRAFHMADVYQKRWDSVRDGVEAVRWLIDNGYAMKGRVAAYGASYGGFMAVATVIEGQDLFGASVNRVGIVNFKTFLERTSVYRRHLREVQYGPLSDPEFLDSISPINRIDEINVPMMIVHGVNDPRVPLHEAVQLAVGLQRRGHDPEILFFHDEGHGLSKLENRILYLQRLERFLDRTVGRAAAVEEPAALDEPGHEARRRPRLRLFCR